MKYGRSPSGFVRVTLISYKTHLNPCMWGCAKKLSKSQHMAHTQLNLHYHCF